MRFIIPALILLVSSTAYAAAPEARCTELGANCLCSEPLNTNVYTSSAEYAWPGGDVTPDTKECRPEALRSNLGSSLAWNQFLNIIAPTGLPVSATGQVNYVWKFTEKGAMSADVYMPNLPSGTQRFCMRYYFKYGDGSMPTGCGKVGEFTQVSRLLDTTHDIKVQATTGTLSQSWSMYSPGHPSNWFERQIGMAGDLTVGDCSSDAAFGSRQDNWCRMEYCEQGDFTNGGASGSNPTAQFSNEAHVVRIRDGKRADAVLAVAGGNNGIPDMRIFEDSLIAHMYRGQEYCCTQLGPTGECLPGFENPDLDSFDTDVQISHAMAATWPTAAGQMIGAAAEIETCIDGVDCYCDKVKNPLHAFYDPDLLMCEDFETATLHGDHPVGVGAPLYGPWYDATGSPPGFNYRGNNSWWNREYPNASGACSWHNDMVGTPQFGANCTHEQQYEGCFPSEWSIGNMWDDADACIDILRNGEFNDEVATLTEPLKPDGSRGVWDGKQTLGARVPPGVQGQEVNTSGFFGTKSFGHTVTQLGLTMALAYSSNTPTTGILNGPLKHDEYVNTYNEHSAFWNLGWQDNQGPNSSRPYRPVLLTEGEAQCDAALANATVHVGYQNPDQPYKAYCTSIALYYSADPSVYDQATDFPWGNWGCHQAHISGLGTSNVTIKLWHNEVLVFHMSGFDGAALRDQGYQAMEFDNYANVNANQGSPPTTQTFYRYQDNMHYTEGPPVSCSQIAGATGVSPTVEAPSTAVLTRNP